MTALPSYHSKAEKCVVFTNCVFCDSEHEVRGWLADLEGGRFDGRGMAFRGMTRASYMLYSSLQRKWMVLDQAVKESDVKILVQNVLEESFRKGVDGTVLPNGARDELAILSYLQHHGCPTPFLDFTTDIRVALFFASEDPGDEGNGSKLDDFFSVYVFQPQIVTAMNSGLEKAWHATSPVESEAAARWFRSYEMNSLQNTLIFHPEWIHRVYGEGVVNLATSDRFRRQSGLFAMNNTTDLPFAEAIHAFIDARSQDVQERRSVRTWITSLNIHREHADLVRIGSVDRTRH